VVWFPKQNPYNKKTPTDAMLYLHFNKAQWYEDTEKTKNKYPYISQTKKSRKKRNSKITSIPSKSNALTLTILPSKSNALTLTILY
jgi:hypothetical protein